MKYATFFFASFMMMSLLTASCRKKSNSSPAATTGTTKFAGCRISQIIEKGVNSTTQTTYNFTYNNDGTVAGISYTALPDKVDVFAITFTYNPNCIIAYTTDNSESYSKDSLALDSQNRIVYINHYDYNGDPPPNEMWDSYQYDSLGDMVLHTNNDYSTLTTQTFQWKNGDIAWNTSGTDFYTYVYGTTAYNTGNINAQISQFENYGRGIYTPMHLYSQAILDSTDTINFIYTTDADGKLTNVTETEPGNYVMTTQIIYECE